jgi:hypothetical protein
MTNQARSILIKEEIIDRSSFKFEGCPVDSKGRMPGCRTTWTAIELTPMPEDYRGTFYSMESGSWIGVQIHAQKDGVDFGAWTPPRFFRTEDEARAYAAKRYKDMRKRASK